MMDFLRMLSSPSFAVSVQNKELLFASVLGVAVVISGMIYLSLRYKKRSVTKGQ